VSVPTQGPRAASFPEWACAVIGSAATVIAMATAAPVPNARFLLRTNLFPNQNGGEAEELHPQKIKLNLVRNLKPSQVNDLSGQFGYTR
jgi:hypothetical protein